MLNNFIYSKLKSLFEEKLTAGEVPQEAIVFIEDTKEIWNHGTYFSTKLTTSEIEGIINSSKTIDELYQKLEEEKNRAESEENYVKMLFDSLLSGSNSLKFYCIEEVTVNITSSLNSSENRSYIYSPGTNVEVSILGGETFEIIPTSNSSISTLTSWPGALGTWYPWLEGVQLFEGIIFDMNNLEMYEKWNQGHQGQYRVQFAQYANCIFWSDNAYVSDVSSRTNYTLYYSSQLPLCYSNIPENTFKSFYCAYGVTSDPNWSNPAYRDSFAQATWATQVFSYYGLHSIGVFDQDSDLFTITLPKDCRGLMFAAGNILNAGIFDATNVTNFGAKSGSWRDAFGYCTMLKNLYIKNLKVNLNISWSPVNQDSLNFILSNAANTSKITISLSPFTYYELTDTNKTLAQEKNITLELITTNMAEDKRLSSIKLNGDGSKYLNDKGEYVEIEIPEASESITEDTISDWGFTKKIPQVEHGTEDTTFTLTPNVFHVWGEVESLTLNLEEPEEGMMSEYLFQFTSGSTPTTLILPSSVKWMHFTPEIEADATYQCSIVNNLGIICGV